MHENKLWGTGHELCVRMNDWMRPVSKNGLQAILFRLLIAFRPVKASHSKGQTIITILLNSRIVVVILLNRIALLIRSF